MQIKKNNICTNIKKISLSENIKNAGKISLGTILGQFMSIVTLPILTRIYGPVIIGNFALFNSIAIIINSFSDFGITNAIMIEETDDDAYKVYRITSTISLIMSFITGIVIYMYSDAFFEGVSLNRYFSILMIVILTFTLQQIQICYTWLNRKKQYNVLMKNPLLNNISVTIVAIALGITKYRQYGYYIAIIIGQIVTIINMKRFLPRGIICMNFYEYKEILKKHSKFITYQMPSNIILQIKGQLPTLLIKAFFGSTILGYYTVCIRVLNMPITFLAKALGKVFFQHISELKRRGCDVGDFVLRSIKKSMKISFIPIVLMLIFGDIVIVILFGENYIISANILRIMTFYGLFLFLSMSTSGIAIVLEKQKYMMISGIFQVVGFSIGIWMGYIFNSIYIGVALMSITFVIIQIIYFSSLFKSINIPIEKYLKPLVIEVLLILLVYIIFRKVLILINIVNGM